MKRLRTLAAVIVLALALLAVWVSGLGRRPGPATDSDSDAAATAYDYEARDVVVRQMGPDGALQYEVEARQITQLPRNGQISARELVLRHDPPGSPPGGEHRWTITAEQADLPQEGGVVTLQGKVRAQGRPLNSQASVLLVTEQLAYGLDTQDLTSEAEVALVWGRNTLHGRALRANIKTGMVALESKVDGTLEP